MNMENSKTGKNSSNYRIMMFASTNECIYFSLPFHSLYIHFIFLFFFVQKELQYNKKEREREKAKEDVKREPATKSQQVCA